MLRKLEYKNSESPGDSDNGQLLRDIEEISKALYLRKAPSNNARSKSAGKVRSSEPKSSLNRRIVREESLHKDKKSSSVWNWKKPLKALTHIGDKKFHCRFYLHVHSIEGLHPNFDNLSLCVHWKRKNEVVRTSFTKVSQGIAEFEETLINQCSVYGSSGGPDHPVKYESKLFLLYASVVEAPGLDIGKQWVDLTSFIPRTLEELEGEKSQGQWTTSFNLSGKAKGASLNVSFGFWVMRDKLPNLSGYSKFPELPNMVRNRSSMDNRFNLDRSNYNRMIGRVASIPSTVNYGTDFSHQSLYVKVCREMLLRTGLELSNSLNCLYQKLDEGNLCISDSSDSQHLEKHKAKIDLDFVSAEEIESFEWDLTEFSITEVGTEISENEVQKLDQADDHTIDGLTIEIINMDELNKDNYIDFNSQMMPFPKEDNSLNNKTEGKVVEHKVELHDCLKGLTIEEQVLACNIQTSESTDSSEYVEQENHMDVKTNYKTNRSVKRSLSLDDVADSVASDFLNMLGLDSGSLPADSDYDPESPRERLLREFEKDALVSGDFMFYSDAKYEESQIGCIIAPGFSSADHSEESGLSLIIHDAEEENKRVSELLKRRKAKILEDLETEALMREWGLNEVDFQNSPRTCSGGFGSPIELAPQELHPLPPLEEGFGPYVQMKSGGFLLSMNPSLFSNAKNGGNLMIQVSNPAVLPAKMGYDIMEIIQNLALIGVENLYEQISKLVTLEEITGKTIKQTESNAPPSLMACQRKVILHHDSCDGSNRNNLESDALVDGLPLEFISLEDISPLIVNKVEGLLLEGLKTQSQTWDKESPSCIFPRLTGKMAASEKTNTIDLVGLSITVDEWLRLDAGNSGDEGSDNEHFLKTLAAHNAKCIDSESQFQHKSSVKKCGLLGNNLAMFHLVQLRDSLGNYEPVGLPMLLLIQVRRRVTGVSSEKDDTGFHIIGVHIAGVNTFPPNKQLWGTTAQQQSGTRWLLGNGVARNVGGYASTSKATVRSSTSGFIKSPPGDILWSISSNVSELGVSWKDLAAHTRNPDVIFQSETTSNSQL